MDPLPASSSSSATTTTNTAQPKPKPRRRRNPPDPHPDSNPNSRSVTPNERSNADRSNRPRRPRRPPPSQPSDAAAISTPNSGPSRRKPRFNAGLTSTDATPASRQNRRTLHTNAPEPTDFTSTLIRGLSVAPYIECIICFSPIHPAQPTWSCSPIIPIAEETSQYCWSTFHLKCIRSWSDKSFKDVRDAWIARGEPEKGGEWRCPGCQGRRCQLISGYRCFCGSTPSPQSRLGMPHSCGNSCSRPRTTCTHPCPLQCHPGPCPPCKITVQVSCGCPRSRVIEVKCFDHVGGADTLSCGEICSRPLNCGRPDHLCQQPCHNGACSPCDATEVSKCWCGSQEKQGLCGQVSAVYTGEDFSCGTDKGGEPLRGFSCGNVCNHPYDCFKHHCDKICHPIVTSSPAACPLSPTKVSTCPCGKNPIPSDPSSQPPHFPARDKCTDPIPTCSSPCLKPLSNCEHVCSFCCHTGECPPCQVEVIRPCRCGGTTKALKCSVEQQGETLCDRPCLALRACGRHQCSRICCPLASFVTASSKGRGKAKRRTNADDSHLDDTGLHRCDLVCGKMLNCGIHKCEERDHKGLCGPCLQSSFEEQICPCSRTIIPPPIPCGTPLLCGYPCDRPRPPCGHPKVPHNCHEMGLDASCPPCPHLTEKLCACGKKTVRNVKCSIERDKVGCGTVCERLLPCGFHRCERLCHALTDPCGECKAVCGKDQKVCLPAHHPCSHPCHAPSACPEDAPCQSLVALTCGCGRITQHVACGKSVSNTNGHLQQATLRCTPECGIAKRNARLADALGITNDTRPSSSNTFSDELVAFARGNSKFVALVEKAFQEFVVSTKKNQVLPHMPIERRKFVIGLASMYRLDTQMVDQEPHRSVQLIRRVDTRLPPVLISSHLVSAKPIAANHGLGKLADLRSSTSSWRTPLAPTRSTASAATPASAAGRATSATVAHPRPLPVAIESRVPPFPIPPKDQEQIPQDWEDDAV